MLGSTPLRKWWNNEKVAEIQRFKKYLSRGTYFGELL
jgi:hypothetical protein